MEAETLLSMWDLERIEKEEGELMTLLKNGYQLRQLNKAMDSGEFFFLRELTTGKTRAHYAPRTITDIELDPTIFQI